MEMRIWWDYEANPNLPWSYEANYLGQNISGCCRSLHDCWCEIDQKILTVTAPIVQDNNRNLQ